MCYAEMNMHACWPCMVNLAQCMRGLHCAFGAPPSSWTAGVDIEHI